MRLTTRWLHRADATPAYAPVAVPASSNDEEALGHVLDAVGTLVQAVGVYAIDADATAAAETRGLADQWRRHATVGLQHPDAAVDAASRGASVAHRDWVGLTRFVTERRRTEHEYVTRSLDDLRTTVWTLVDGLHGVVGAERSAGNDSRAAVERARGAVTVASPDALRDAALALVDEIAAQLAHREQERESQLAALGAQVQRLGAALEEAQRDNARDPLTGLGNRRALDEGLTHAIAMRGLWRHATSLVVMDVDGLKALNDAQGHPAGDGALCEIGRRLSRAFLRRTDVLCRFGGDEFAAVLRDTSLDQACRLVARVATPGPRDTGAALALSAGVAELHDGETPAQWFARADAALYVAKRRGGAVERA